MTVCANNLTISVVIPVFNSGHDAINAIRSVVNQVGFSVQEIVVVNDGSSDDSADFLSEMCSHLTIPVHIYSVPNGGAANARNYGMSKCSCELYAFLDSDDTWANNKLERQIPFFDDCSVGMVGCLTTAGGRGLSYISSDSPRIISLRQQLFKNYFQTSTVILRREVIESVGNFPVNQRYAEEGDLFNRITESYKCILLPDVLVDYGAGKQGYGSSGLSAHLVAMEKGELRNIIRANVRGNCSFLIFVMAIVYSLAKFTRRIFIVSFRQLMNRVNGVK